MAISPFTVAELDVQARRYRLISHIMLHCDDPDDHICNKLHGLLTEEFAEPTTQEALDAELDKALMFVPEFV